MSEEMQRVNIQVLRQFVPMNELTEDNLKDLASKAEMIALNTGRTLFKEGDDDSFSYYLLSGDVKLVSATGEKIISGGTAPTRFPLDYHRPRRATAVATSPANLLRIDNDLLDILLTWDQNAGYMVTEIEADGSERTAADDSDTDWMANILRSSIFHRVPPTNIQAMFMRMEAVPVRAGEKVIRQGDEGDYFYYVSSGRCLVTRTSAKTGKELTLAELGPSSSFGEEALVSGARRNANVTMLSDGTLMRLKKEDFEALLKEPVLKKVKLGEAQQLVREGGAWLDVRLENEHKNRAIPGSLHIPLYLLRIRANSLDRQRTYIAYCDTGRRSSSAAYLLTERGFNVYVLDGGLQGSEGATGEA